MSNEKNTSDTQDQGVMRPFVFEHLAMRGRLLRLPNVTSHINALDLGDDSLGQTLCEMLMAAVVLAFDMKDKANVTLQITSDGDVPLLLAKCNYKGVLRAFAKKDKEAADAKKTLQGDSKSVFTVTVDYGRDKDAYQSIVPIDADSVSKSLEDYFARSSRLRTLFKVFTGTDDSGRMSCGAMFMQALPGKKDLSEDDWRRMQLILSTLHDHEILPGKVKEIELLQRLFAEDDVRVFPRQEIGFADSGSRARMAEALKSIGADECRDVLRKENGSFTMTDEYTGHGEKFTEEDMRAIFGEDWQK